MARLVPPSEGAMQVAFRPHQPHPFKMHKNLCSDLRHEQTKLYGCISVVIMLASALWQPQLGVECHQRIDSCCGWPSMVRVLLQASGIPLLL